MPQCAAFGALLLLWLLWSGHANAATTGDYARRLDAALSALRTAERSSGADRWHALGRARSLLPTTLRVTVGSIGVFVDLGAVRRDVDAGRLGDAATRLMALRAALDTPAAQSTAPDRARLARLDEIMARPPFVAPTTVWSIIGDLLRRLLSTLHGTPLGGIGDAIERLLGSAAVPVLAGIIAAVAIVFAVTRSFGSLVPRATLPDTEALDPQLERLDAEAARERSRRLAASGEYREAARYLYLATLLALDATGRLRIDRATGNRDVLRQARAVPHLAEALTPVVRGFELFWFGHIPVTRDDYERYQRLNERALEVSR